MSARWLIVAFALIAASGCKRERRKFIDPPPVAADLATRPADRRDEINAYTISEGKRLYTWMNCVGCHAHGGGGMGPALMDRAWIYGSDPQTVFQTIAEGRANGMPSFKSKLSAQQIWQLVGYVRAMAGLVRMDAAPGRNDDMAYKQVESQVKP